MKFAKQSRAVLRGRVFWKLFKRLRNILMCRMFLKLLHRRNWPRKSLVSKRVSVHKNQFVKIKFKYSLIAKDDFEKDDVENDEESQEEEGDVKKTPQRKSKTPKAVVQKRPAKSMKQENFDDEEQTSDDNAPVPPKKMKIRKPSFLPKLPALKKSLVKKEALTDDESEESKLELPAPKIAEVEEPVEVDFMDHMFIQFREPEDENMPEDERIVRKLIKSAVWECINDNSALDTIVRRMRQYFSDDKIKNWDQDELLESIDYERTRSKEKIQECLILKDWDVTNLDNQLLEEDIKAKMKAVSEESDEDEEMDDDKVWK